jgi:bleomycin hydrolase
MKKDALVTLFVFSALLACHRAKKNSVPPAKSNYVFTVVTEVPTLPVGQQKSGTCWAYSTTSFLESEIIRLKGERIDLSEMYFVRHAYTLKAENYILRQGTARFTEGGLNHDPIISLSAVGLVPQAAYLGLGAGNKEYDHAEMIKVLEQTVKKYANPGNKLGAGWRVDIPAQLDSFMGKVPAEFQYEGKTYTPASFLSYTQLNPDDYLTITSFTHVPFYKPFVLSVPANWAYGRFYNLPLEEFIATIDHALEAGFSLALDLDGTEPTFFVEDGIGVLPEKPEDRELIRIDSRPEKIVTQQIRQEAFESFSTTDDHLMHISGKAKDQHGNIFYKCKNSWGPKAGRRGFMYLSVAYMKMKGISVMLYKDGLIDSTRKRIEF